MATICLILLFSGSCSTGDADGNELKIPAGTWVKLSPLDGAPVSPRLGYEGACAWDSLRRVFVRYGGHNQGGGGEQGSEVWTFEPLAARWTLKEPDISPPGVCCAQQYIFEPLQGLFLRFTAFSGSHGWQWWREIYLNDSTVWAYDLPANVWRNRRPVPAPSVKGLRCASWDSDREVVVIFGGETSHEGTIVYDPWANTWTRMKPPREPEFRSGGNMAYDSARRLHILFGAQFSDDRHTWAYDLAKNEWRDMKPDLMPPTDQNDAVLTYDPFRRLIIAIVKITEGKDDDAKHRLETWTYDAGSNVWKKLNPPREPDPTGNRARVLVYAPELDAAILENRTHPPHGPPEQQMWALRLTDRPKDAAMPPARGSAKTRGRPRIVEDAVVSVLSAKSAEISWKAPVDPDIAGYLVERAAVSVLTDDQLRRIKRATPPLAEPSVGALRAIGKFAQLTPSPIQETRYTDSAIDLEAPKPLDGEPLWERSYHSEELDPAGKPYRFAVYAYRILAVGRSGASSGPSPPFFTIPSAPRNLFSKEEGTTCHLRWAANPEKGLRGYRVYRMDGRYDNETISRLSQDPIADTRSSDPGAGKKTRRYYLVAVDSLGQEGFPSSPVWFSREWKKFYEPFAGEWHQ